jgi:hypothetical protein
MRKIKEILGRGIALALPLAIVFYVLYKFMKIVESAIAPLAKKFSVETVFGELTITFFAVLLMLAIVFILGLLMNISLVVKLRRIVESWILKFIPSLNHLKLMAADKLDLENAVSNWKPILLEKGPECIPAYIIEEDVEWITVAIAKGTTTEPKDMLIIKKSSISYQEITMKQMRDFNKQYGKGYISLVSNRGRQ